MFVFIFSVLLIFAPVLVQTEDCIIQGVHLSLGGYYSDSSSSPNTTSLLKITFHTNDQCSDMRVETQKYDYSDELRNITAEDIVGFNITDNSQGYLNIINIYIHTFDVIGVYEFQTTYNYTIYNSSGSKQFYFHLPKRDTDSTMKDLNVAFTGMMDISAYSYNSRSNLTAWATNQSWPIDCIIYLGDMAFNLEDNMYQTGINFFTDIESFAAYIPLMPTPGNRDNANNYDFYSKMIASPLGEYSYYSFNLGYVHFVQVNLDYYFTGTDEATKSEIYNWLSDDLTTANKRTNRIRNPWIIVYGYVSFYCSNSSDVFCGTHTGDAAGLDSLEKLFKNHNVDLYFSSSFWPVYERLKPIYKRTIYEFSSKLEFDTQYVYMVNPLATIYIIEAAAGNDLFYNESSSLAANLHTYDKGFYSLRADSWTGIGIMTVKSATEIDYRHYSMEDDATTPMTDIFTLINTLTKYEDDWPYTDKVTFITASIVFTIIGATVLILFMLNLE